MAQNRNYDSISLKENLEKERIEDVSIVIVPMSKETDNMINSYSLEQSQDVGPCSVLSNVEACSPIVSYSFECSNERKKREVKTQMCQVNF